MDTAATAENPNHRLTRAPYPARTPKPALRVAMGDREGASFRVKVDALAIAGKSKFPGGGRIIHAVALPSTDRAIAFSERS